MTLENLVFSQDKSEFIHIRLHENVKNKNRVGRWFQITSNDPELWFVHFLKNFNRHEAAQQSLLGCMKKESYLLFPDNPETPYMCAEQDFEWQENADNVLQKHPRENACSILLQCPQDDEDLNTYFTRINEEFFERAKEIRPLIAMLELLADIVPPPPTPSPKDLYKEDHPLKRLVTAWPKDNPIKIVHAPDAHANNLGTVSFVCHGLRIAMAQPSGSTNYRVKVHGKEDDFIFNADEPKAFLAALEAANNDI